MSGRVEHILSPVALRAMSQSLSLAATVLGFDIVELWSDSGNGKLHCTFVHANEDVIAKYPNVIFGYFPDHQRDHKLSPLLCDLCRKSGRKYYWHIIPKSKKGGPVNSDENDAALDKAHEEVNLPVRTEMAYLLDGKCEGASIFIVALAFDAVEYKDSKIRFLSGLGYAIYVAAFDFDFDDEDDDDDESCGDRVEENHELDVKAFVPMRQFQPTPLPSDANLAGMSAVSSVPNLSSGLGIWGHNLSSAVLSALNTPRPHSDSIADSLSAGRSPRSNQLSPRSNQATPRGNVGLMLTDSLHDEYKGDASEEGSKGAEKGRSSPSSPLIGLTLSPTPPASSKKAVMIPLLALGQLSSPPSEKKGGEFDVGLVDPSSPRDTVMHSGRRSSQGSSIVSAERERTVMFSIGLPEVSSILPHTSDLDEEGLQTARSEVSVVLNNAILNLAPTWEPATPFCFPVAEISVKQRLMDDLTLSQLTDVRHIADGSNSNIFVGRLNKEKVIIKMIKEEAQNNAVAMHEFDLEHGMLARMSHPNIIKVLGAGNVPRRFIVLEHLGGGTLSNILAENQYKPGLAMRIFHKPTFTFIDLLYKARDMASALDYLHTKCHIGACVIHRDLKPDNVGFASDGSLKLFDFGLATCVRSRTSLAEAYDMTGYTGSLRYMAPEVALRQPYTEKVDVYSFGIMLWQMARDRVPFKGYNKDNFIKQVVIGGERPKLDSSWPHAFTDLLTRCWYKDAKVRPSFEAIKGELDILIGEVLDIKHGRAKKGKLLKGKSDSAIKSPTGSWF
eukprot:gene25890-31264_t